MSKKVRNFLLYAGVTKEDYDRIKPRIMRTNRTMTIIVSAFAAILISVMYVLVSHVAGIQTNRVVYEVGMVVSIALYLASVFLTKKDIRLVTPFMMAAYSVFYIYGILIGCITSPGEKTVTFIVMLVFLPVLFIDRPLHVIVVTSSYVAIFIALCLRTKTGAVLENDVVDAMVFAILGLSSGITINRIKIRGYVSEEKLESTVAKLAEANEKLQHLNRTDSMTGIQNRAAYDVDLIKIPYMPKICLGCIYIDADGLKKINDSMGHQAGDELLKFTAKQIAVEFGNDLSYRIGGDEFVVFVVDPKDREISTRVDRMRMKIEAEGYHVSVGWEIHDLDKLSLKVLEREADERMKRKKEKFKIEHPEYDRDNPQEIGDKMWTGAEAGVGAGAGIETGTD